MKNEPDFGYFGKGTTGYVHYMETHKQCYPNTNANVFSLFNIIKWVVALWFAYYALYFAFMMFTCFGMFFYDSFFEGLKMLGLGVFGLVASSAMTYFFYKM